MSDNIRTDSIELLCTKEDFIELMDDNSALCAELAAANKRIAELEERHEKFLQEFWNTNAENERLRAAIDLVMKYDSNLIDALATAKENDDG